MKEYNNEIDRILVKDNVKENLKEIEKESLKEMKCMKEEMKI